ncbi:MAG: response regulator [Armatimonadetes bacterium]|nr:response regulator [Armatimonadota bacterium]
MAYCILVIDDEEEARESIQRRLRREGYQVETAPSQEEGIQRIRDAKDSYDLVITDMLMEQANSGVEVLRASVQRDLFTEVIVLTAYGNVSNAVECMKQGAFDYIEKNIPGVDPYDLLVIKVGQALERRKAALGTLRRLERAGLYGPGAVPKA